MKVCHEEGAEVMIASHNQKSIERAVSLMHELGVEPQQSGIYFGQLLGMADHLTFILGRNGYRVSAPISHMLNPVDSASCIQCHSTSCSAVNFRVLKCCQLG